MIHESYDLYDTYDSYFRLLLIQNGWDAHSHDVWRTCRMPNACINKGTTFLKAGFGLRHVPQGHISIADSRHQTNFDEQRRRNLEEDQHLGTREILENTTSLFDTSPHSNTARRDVRYSFCKAHSRGFTRNIGMNKSCPEAICSQCWLTTSMSTVCSIWRKT